MKKSRRVLAVPLLLLIAGLVFPAQQTAHAAGPLIRLSRGAAAWGDKFSVSGYNFKAGDTVVVSLPYISGGNQKRVDTTVQADGSGNFTAGLTVPGDAAQNLYTVTARDFHGGVAGTDLWVLARLFLQPGKQPTVWALGNHGFFANGTGFGANETVTIRVSFPLYDGNDVVVTARPTTDSKGNLPETFIKIPQNVMVGSAELTATGPQSQKVAKATVRVVYHPSISLDASTVRPGNSLGVRGRDFVPGSNITVAVTIPRTGAATETLSRTAPADGSGSVRVSIYLPADTKPGTYRVSARDSASGIQTATNVIASIHPRISVNPGSAYPGQAVTVTGGGFSGNTQVTLSATISTSSGLRTVSTTVRTNSSGAFTAQLGLPSNANPSTVNVFAKESNGQASAQLRVQQLPATSTPTAKPTSTTNPTSAPTLTPVPPTGTPVPPRHTSALGFRYISIWYHTVRRGTYNHIVIQSTRKKKLGIWVHIYFPSGLHYDFYQNTDSSGRWEKQFSVPRNAVSRRSNQVVITLQLWQGRHTNKDIRIFVLV